MFLSAFTFNVYLTLKLVKKVIINFDLSQASRPDCIQMVVLKNCESELSYILAKLFNICLGEFCFPYCWKVSSLVPVFKNVRKRSTVKDYDLNCLVNPPEKCDFFHISSMFSGHLDQ